MGTGDQKEDTQRMWVTPQTPTAKYVSLAGHLKSVTLTTPIISGGETEGYGSESVSQAEWGTGD